MVPARIVATLIKENARHAKVLGKDKILFRQAY